MTPKRARSGPEWVTFVVASFVLLALVGMIAVQIPKHTRPAAPTVTVGRIEQRADSFSVAVSLENEGDLTAANVQVVATLTVDDEPVESDQVVDFLAGGATEDLVFVFADDPAEGELEVRVGGFTEP